MLLAGLDEAGRGPVLGPLVIGCVLFSDDKLPILDEMGIDDSKKIPPQKRQKLARLIKENCDEWQIFVISPQMINDLHFKSRKSLNQIEEMHFALLLNKMRQKPDEVYLDACDPVETRFGESIGKQLTFTPQKIISKHNGDALFKIVGASSILAKTARDDIVNSYHNKFGDCGSGYPSDPKTKRFLLDYYYKHQKFPNIVRLWWKTAINIKKQYHEEKYQKKLTDF